MRLLSKIENRFWQAPNFLDAGLTVEEHLPYSLVVRIARFHRAGRGSIPRGGTFSTLLWVGQHKCGSRFNVRTRYVRGLRLPWRPFQRFHFSAALELH